MAEKTTRYVILGFLAQNPSLSGYDIRKLIGLSVGHFWNESFGQLYPELHRLTKAGLISAIAGGTGKRKRTSYRITAHGRRTLRAWLERPAAPERIRNELLLKVFFGRNVGRERILSLLQSGSARWRADATAFAEAQRMILEDVESADLVYYLITLRHGRWVRAARLRWASEASELLQLAQERGNRALLAQVKRLEGVLP